MDFNLCKIRRWLLGLFVKQEHSEAEVALWQPLFMRLLYTDVYCWVGWLGTVESKAVCFPSWVRWNGLAGEQYQLFPGSTKCVYSRGLPRAILTVGRGKDVRFGEQEFSSVSAGWPWDLQKRRLLLIPHSLLLQLRNLMKDGWEQPWRKGPVLLGLDD